MTRMNSQTKIIVATACALAVVDIAVRLFAPANTVVVRQGGLSADTLSVRTLRIVDDNGQARVTLSLDGNSGVLAGQGVSGGVTIAGGSLILDYAGIATGSSILKSTNSLTFTGSGTLRLSGDATNPSAASFAALNFSGGEGTIQSVFATMSR